MNPTSPPPANPDAVDPQTPETQTPAPTPVPSEGAEAPKQEAPKEVDPKQAVPESYELKLKDGSPLTPEDVEAVAKFAKEHGYTQAQAQAHLEREQEVISSFMSKQQRQFETAVSEWKQQAEADKEIGGEHYKKNVELAHRALDRFATPELLEILSTGYGNHPELVRTFARIGKEFSDDEAVIPGTNQPGQKPSRAELFYGNSK